MPADSPRSTADDRALTWGDDGATTREEGDDPGVPGDAEARDQSDDGIPDPPLIDDPRPSDGGGDAAVPWADPTPGTMTPGPDPDGVGSPAGPGPAASVRRALRARRRPGTRPAARGRGRRVHQRLWSIDPWSVFKISALFYLCFFAILMVAGTLLWSVARSSGAIESIESSVTRLGAYGECVPESEVPEGTDVATDCDDEGEVRVGGFVLDDGTVFRAATTGAVVLAVTGSAGNVLMVLLLNLINEVTGGLRYTIIRESEARRRGPGGEGPAKGSLLARLRR